MNRTLTYEQQKQALEDAFVRQLLIKHNIKEVTTQRQAKNGTREFEFPVSCTSPNTRFRDFRSKNKLRMAIFKSGFTRRQNGCYCPYPINRRYSRLHKYTVMVDGKLTTRKYMTMAYEKHMNAMTSLNYMLNYYLKNYAK